MNKQDRQGVRTPADLERKYNFGKTFSELMGLANDAQKAADDAQKTANTARSEVIRLADSITLTVIGGTPGSKASIVLKVGETEYSGEINLQGLVTFENLGTEGATVINGSNITTGTILANLIKAGILQSKDGETFYLDLDNGVLKGRFEELSISGKKVITGDVLEEYANAITESIDNLQQQIDGQIQSWFYDYIPTTSNYPASEWTTDSLKTVHLGDLFYIVDNEESGGLTYRWAMVCDSYQWVLVEDSDVAKALAQAAQAQDTADGKRRVFVVQPTPPYDIGDLWTDGADLKVCQTVRLSGSYYATDWKLATDYIDSETAAGIAQSKVDAQTQQDIFNRLTNNGALEGVYMEDGQLYINASYLATGILTSKDGETFYLDLDKGVLKGKFAEFSISGKTVPEIAQEKADAAETNAIGAAATDATNKANNAQSNAISAAAADATSKANAAQSNAISTAASDATNKANAAQQSAISAAAADATNKANSALSSAKGYTDSLNSLLNQQEVFNRLTNNGTLPGLYMENGQLYINASYLKSGIIDASIIEVVNLVAEKLSSASGQSVLDVSGAMLQMTYDGKQTFYVNNEYGKYAQLVFQVSDENGNLEQAGFFNAHQIEFGGPGVGDRMYIGVDTTSMQPYMILPNDPYKMLTLSWKDNGNGTFNLIGLEDPSETNPGKTKLFSGNVAMGDSCAVPGTSLYDLFAVKLGDSGTTYDTVVLAYKTGSVVRGVGGWAGTASQSKQLYFFSASVSGDTWTVEDAGVHNLYIGGTVEEGVRLNLKEIIGII